MASESMDSPLAGDTTTPPSRKAGPDKASAGAAVTPGMSAASGGRGEAAAPMNRAPGGNGLPSLSGKPAPEDRDQSLIATSLARRALCPDCVHLGGCEKGIPGLLPLPEKGEIEPLTKTKKSYLEKLIANGVVRGSRILSTEDAARGETYLIGPSLCAAVKRGEIKLGEKEGE
jgi:hypothetical protein